MSGSKYARGNRHASRCTGPVSTAQELSLLVSGWRHQCHSVRWCGGNNKQQMCMLSDAGDAGAFPSLPKFPHVMITSLLDAVKYGSREARLLFPRLLQIVALYPDTINNFISTVCALCLMFIHYLQQTGQFVIHWLLMAKWLFKLWLCAIVWWGVYCVKLLSFRKCDCISHV